MYKDLAISFFFIAFAGFVAYMGWQEYQEVTTAKPVAIWEKRNCTLITVTLAKWEELPDVLIKYNNTPVTYDYNEMIRHCPETFALVVTIGDKTLQFPLIETRS